MWFEPGTWMWLVFGVVGVLLSAVYSGVETGIYCLNRVRLELFAHRGRWAARYLQRTLGAGTMMLIVLLLANNLSNYLATVAAAYLFEAAGQSSQRAMLFTCLLVTPLLFVFGEMVPKNLFQQFPDTLTYRFAWVLRVGDWIGRYSGLALLIHWLIDGLLKLAGAPHAAKRLTTPRQRIRAMLADTHAAGVLSRNQADIVDRVMGLAQVLLRSVLIPLSHVVAIDAGATRSQLIEIIRPHPYSRLPVYEGERSNIVGVLNVYDVLADTRQEGAVRRHLRPTVRLGEQLGISHALFRLQRQHQTMGIITDRRNRVIGMVTLKDLVEEIVGELAAW